MNTIKNYWEQAISFPEYLKDIEKEIHSNKNPDFTPYYELNKKRINRISHTFKATDSLKERFEQLNFSGKLLIISEGWCGDAAQSVPVIYQFFEKYLEIKIVYRDQNELINQYLTDGSKSIPIVLVLNNNYEVIAHWGPRPDYGNDLFYKYKNDEVAYPKEQFMEDMQMAYNKDKGLSIIEEMIHAIADGSI
jgi:hypothetical protein